MDKKELRNQGRTTAKDTKDKHGADYDQQITDRFFASQHFMPRSHISLFMALKGEVSCMSIIKKLGQQGHIVCLPVIMGPSEPMIFREYFLGDSTRPGMMGQHEPLDNATEIIPDTVVVPMLGFNREGCRLGYGSGFFDRTLEALRKSKPIRVIGLAYSAQEMPELKSESHDALMDVIITEKEVIQVK